MATQFYPPLGSGGGSGVQFADIDTAAEINAATTDADFAVAGALNGADITSGNIARARINDALSANAAPVTATTLAITGATTFGANATFSYTGEGVALHGGGTITGANGEITHTVGLTKAVIISDGTRTLRLLPPNGTTAVIEVDSVTTGLDFNTQWSGGTYNFKIAGFQVLGISPGFLRLGPGTSAYAALKASGASLAVRLADDSADAPLTASNLQLPQSASAPTPGSNSAVFYSLDVAGVAEAYARSETGAGVQLTAHPVDAPPELYDEEPGLERFDKTVQHYLGTITWTNQDRVARLAGMTDAEKSALPSEKRRTAPLRESFADYNARLNLTGEKALKAEVWEEVQLAQKAEQDAKIADWQARKDEHEQKPGAEPFPEAKPPEFVAKPIPDRIKNRLKKEQSGKLEAEPEN